jgi:hypothetical protein
MSVTRKALSWRMRLAGMCFLCLGVVLLPSLPAAAQENEAEKLFRSMEKKIRSAKSLEIVFKGELAAERLKTTFAGKVRLAQGNVFRMEVDVEVDGKRQERLMVCDGKTVYNKDKDAGRVKTYPARADDTLKVQAFVSRVGVNLAALLLGETIPVDPPKDAEPFDLDKAAPLSDFKAGAREHVGQKEAQAVAYSVRGGRRLDYASMVVWVDLQTQLPLKRTIEMRLAGSLVRWVETYTTFAPEAKIDGKVFSAPR